MPLPRFLRVAVRCQLADPFLRPVVFRSASLLLLAMTATTAYTQLLKLPPGAWLAAAVLATAFTVKDPLAR
jgi:hypothetical protein